MESPTSPVDIQDLVDCIYCFPTHVHVCWRMCRGTKSVVICLQKFRQWEKKVGVLPLWSLKQPPWLPRAYEDQVTRTSVDLTVSWAQQRFFLALGFHLNDLENEMRKVDCETNWLQFLIKDLSATVYTAFQDSFNFPWVSLHLPTLRNVAQKRHFCDMEFAFAFCHTEPVFL